METTKIFMEADKAAEHYKRYLKNRHYERPEDAEIRKAYRLLAKGQLIIRALDSIKASGLGNDGYPRLCIASATSPACWLQAWSDGSATMKGDDRWSVPAREWKNVYRWPGGSFPGIKTARWGMKAIMPIIPADVRPKRGLENYHVLWEAEWEPVPPRDPYLLQRIGRSDLWVVLAMWDLTEVEQAVLAGRIGRPN